MKTMEYHYEGTFHPASFHLKALGPEKVLPLQFFSLQERWELGWGNKVVRFNPTALSTVPPLRGSLPWETRPEPNVDHCIQNWVGALDLHLFSGVSAWDCRGYPPSLHPCVCVLIVGCYSVAFSLSQWEPRQQDPLWAKVGWLWH